MQGHGNGNGAAAKAKVGMAPTTSSGETQKLSENARVILAKRYLRKDDFGNPIETPEDLFHRVANAIAEGEVEGARAVWGGRFYDLMTSLKFLPNSPTLVNAGTDRGCLSACFVASTSSSFAITINLPLRAFTSAMAFATRRNKSSGSSMGLPSASFRR